MPALVWLNLILIPLEHALQVIKESSVAIAWLVTLDPRILNAQNVLTHL